MDIFIYDWRGSSININWTKELRQTVGTPFVFCNYIRCIPKARYGIVFLVEVSFFSKCIFCWGIRRAPQVRCTPVVLFLALLIVLLVSCVHVHARVGEEKFITAWREVFFVFFPPTMPIGNIDCSYIAIDSKNPFSVKKKRCCQKPTPRKWAP